MLLIKQIMEKVLIMSENNNKKEDGRVRYTKMRIRSAFYELIQEMEPEKITVTAICKKAEINRATFYKHYLDVPDLTDKLQEETIEQFAAKLNNAMKDSPETFIIDVLQFMKSNMQDKTLAGVINMHTAAKFTSKITSMIYHYFSVYMKSQIKNVPEEDQDIIFSYIAAGCAGIIDYWVKTGYKMDVTLVADKMTHISAATINNIK